MASIAFVSAIGAAGLLLLSDLGAEAAMPGPLSSNHAPLRDNCAACHVESADAIQSVLHGLSTTRIDLGQSELCLECHDLGHDALFAHGWPIERAPLTERARVPTGPGDEVACGMCHREHRGRHDSLTAIDDARCQACHAEPFESLEDGHPALTDYPYTHRLNLAFDHATHLRDHFPNHEPTNGASVPTACTACHALDPSGERMPVRGYDAMCAACHDDDIRGSSQIDGAGLAFLGLPALDTMTLEERGIAIGRWPADSMVTEVPMTPFLELLLSADPARAADLRRLESVDLLDLSSADDETLTAVERVAWDVKAIFEEVGRGGHSALLERLGRATGNEIELELADSLLTRLPEDLFAEALRSWLPDLSLEMQRHRNGERVATDATIPIAASDSEPVDAESDRRREAWVRSGGWFLRDLDFEIRYRPGGHADSFLRAWTDLTAGNDDATRPLFDAITAPGAVGMCSKCHAIDEVDGDVSVRWRGTAAPREARELVRFSHVAHFASPSDNACLDCHELEIKTDGFFEAYAERDATQFVSAFRSIELDTCVRCHGDAGASPACLTCHSYHPRGPIGRLPSALLEAVRR